MYTHCPHCHTIFRIHTRQLAQARGQVRCGVCSGVFNALEGLTEQLTAPPSAPAVEPDLAAAPNTASGPTVATPLPDAAPAELTVVEAMEAEEAAGALETADASGELNRTTAAETASEEIATGVTPHARPEDAALPDLGIIAAEPRALPAGEATRPVPLWKTALWAAANVLLIVALMGQYLYYNRQQLAQYTELRPWVAQMCAVMRCDIPLQRDVKRIALTSRMVESHPTRPNALLIDATLVNQADFTQPYPLLELRFSDLNNQLIAGRRFRPSEYLPPGTALQAGMAPHQPVHVTLEIVDPGKDAVSFQFDLL
jgi:predicted Zn finger-like uncharacterized protein